MLLQGFHPAESTVVVGKDPAFRFFPLRQSMVYRMISLLEHQIGAVERLAVTVLYGIQNALRPVFFQKCCGFGAVHLKILVNHDISGPSCSIFQNVSGIFQEDGVIIEPQIIPGIFVVGADIINPVVFDQADQALLPDRRAEDDERGAAPVDEIPDSADFPLCCFPS